MTKKKSPMPKSIVIKSEAEFKPGSKPYLEFDGAMLNANVPWDELVLELNEHGCDNHEIAAYIECDTAIIMQIQAKNFKNLSFRAGARMITLHSKHYPDFYCQ